LASFRPIQTYLKTCIFFSDRTPNHSTRHCSGDFPRPGTISSSRWTATFLIGPEELYQGIARMLKKRCDVAIASKYVPGSRATNRPCGRLFVSRASGFAIRTVIAFRVRDYSNGYRFARAQPRNRSPAAGSALSGPTRPDQRLSPSPYDRIWSLDAARSGRTDRLL